MYSIHCIHTTIHLKTLIQSVPPLQHSTHNFNNGTVASPSPSQEKRQEKCKKCNYSIVTIHAFRQAA